MIFRCIIFFSACLLSAGTLFAQQAAVEMPLAERIKSSPAIFEGKVLARVSFWNQEHTGIFTVNIIEVSKVFKGNIVTVKTEIITPGGTVGTQIETLSEGIELAQGDAGLFFCDYSPMLNWSSDKSLSYCYELFLNSQGFIKYDPTGKIASDQYRKYPDIEKDIYSAITGVTGKPYKTVK